MATSLGLDHNPSGESGPLVQITIVAVEVTVPSAFAAAQTAELEVEFPRSLAGRRPAFARPANHDSASLPRSTAAPSKSPRQISRWRRPPTPQAPEDRYPYSISLQDGKHFCGGSLIAADCILTAAHCLAGGWFDVRVGSDDVDNGPLIETRKKFPHPDYNGQCRVELR